MNISFFLQRLCRTADVHQQTTDRHWPLLNAVLSLLMLVSAIALITPAHAEPKGFRLLNAMLYKDMPAFGEHQVVVYEQHFFKHGLLADGIRPSDKGVANAVSNAQMQQKLSRFENTNPIVALDIERWQTWPFVTLPEHKKSIEHYADAAQRFSQQSGDPVCLYSTLPAGGIVSSSRAVRDEAVREQWRQSVAIAAEKITSVVSALCPQFYSYYRLPDKPEVALAQWKQFVSSSIALARELAPGLPVYPFVWPQYHAGGNVKDYAYVDDKTWRAQLEHLRQHADGMILWGGYDILGGKQLLWNDDAPWWRQLRQVFPALTTFKQR